jgi:hypothetical protein
VNGTIHLGVSDLGEWNHRRGAGGLAVKIEFHAGSGREHIVGYLIVIFEADCVPRFDGDFGLRKVAALLGDLMVRRKHWERGQSRKGDGEKSAEDFLTDHG